MTLFSQKSWSVETETLPAVGNASQNCQVYLTDAFWLRIALSISFGSKSEGKNEEKEIQRRSSDTYHSFIPSVNHQK